VRVRGFDDKVWCLRWKTGDRASREAENENSEDAKDLDS
jgi:hypothetical protein